MKNKKQIILIGILLIILIIVGIILYDFNNSSYLIQLSPQGTRQMMGYVLKTNTSKLIVIDGGTIEDTEQLIKKINENGKKVDAWFLTHAHDDHVGAFTQIVKNTDIEIENIYVSVNEISWYEQNEPSRIEFTKTFLETLNLDKINNKVIETNLNQKIIIDNLEIEILGIKNPEITENAGNEQSMIFSINTGKNKLLFLGDAGEKTSKKLLKNQKEKLKSDIVQMSHHGQDGATKELYQVVNPKICLWPTPEWLWNNDAGTGKNTGTLKTMDTRAWMKELNVKKHYIAKDGNITIKIR